jgi:hypothetical protein
VRSGHRSALRRRKQRSGRARVATQLAVPVALGLLVGGVLAYQAGSTNNAVQPAPLGAVPTPTPSFGNPPASTVTGAVMPPSPTWLTPLASLTPLVSLTPLASLTPSTATTSNAGKQTATADASGR